MTTAGTVGESEDEFTPLSVEEARTLMSEALTDLDRDALLAERAEAEAQLRAAEATLSVPPADGSGPGDVEQEREEPAQKPHNMESPNRSVVELDVEALLAAAARARRADDEVALAASEAAERPPALETQVSAADSAFTRMMEIREELPATWRRLVGAMISATGMAIVVGALGWNVYWLLVPIALILVMTVDLRLAGKSLREASTEASGELGSVAGVGPDDLDRIRVHRVRLEEAEGRLAAARAERETAYALFEELAPGRRPSEVDEIVAEHEADRAARAAAEAEREAQAEAARVAEPETEPEAEAPAEPEAPTLSVPEPAADDPAVTASDPAPETTPVTASEWWFGSKEAPQAPATAAEPVRALAERLSAEGREALARIQAQLDTLDRVDLAKKSLEWHEANGSSGTNGSKEGAADSPPEKS